LASLLISSNYLLLFIRKNKRLIPRSSLLINNTILKTFQTTICPKIINTDLAITSEPVINIPSPVIIIIIFRSYILYIKDPNTTYRSIYRKNKRLRKLNSRIEISTNLDPEISITLINALVVLIYNILPNLKKKRIIRIIRTN
jgi:hypothetical protein